MNTKFQIQIKTHNYNGGSPVITKEVTLNDIAKFASLMVAINNNIGKQTWNWFGKGKGLPDTWDGKHFVLDTWRLCKHMDENFGYKIEDINLFKEFFIRFTPHGCDGIEWIKLFKVEEMELK